MVVNKQNINALGALTLTKVEIDADGIVYREISKKYFRVNRIIYFYLYSFSGVLAKAWGSNTINLSTNHFSKLQQ